MDTLPLEIVNEILLLTDKPSLKHTSQVCLLWRRLSLTRTNPINNKNDLSKAYETGDYLSVTQSKFNKNWVDFGLIGACSGGCKEMVELMIAKGADDWNNGLIGACLGGHKEMVELMIAKGADDLNSESSEDIILITKNKQYSLKDL